mgnify:FL=1
MGGRSYHQSGRLEDARSMFEKAVPALQNIYGETHVHTLAMVNNLAELYVDLGELELAKPLYEYAIENGSKVLPEDHQYLQAFKKGYKDCLDRLSVVSEEQQ